MQFDERTQSASADKTADKTAGKSAGNSANRPHRPKQHSVGTTHTGFDVQEPAPLSAARIAAEAAFGGPAFKVNECGQARITVRRTRVIPQIDRAAEVMQPQTEDSVSKAPRVFRIEGVRVLAAAPLSPSAANLPSTPKQAGHSSEQAFRTRKRRAPEKQPGPLVMVVHKPPTPQPAPAILPAPRSQTLTESLNRITSVIAAIEKAQSLWFIDFRFEAHYQRLSKQADKLLKQLRSRQR